MAIQQCAGTQEAPTPKPSKAEKRLAKKLKQFDVLPETAFVDLKVVCAVRGRSPSSTQRDVKAGRLAPPIRIGPNAMRYRVGDVRKSLKGAKTAQNLLDASADPIDLDDTPNTMSGREKRGDENE